jgi:hypothetical protein
LPPLSRTMKPKPFLHCTTLPCRTLRPWRDRPEKMQFAPAAPASAALATRFWGRRSGSPSPAVPLAPLRYEPQASPRRNAAVAAASEHAYMKEGIARTIGKLDEAEPFVRVVPLDGRPNRRTRGAVKLWTARRCISEIAGRRLIAVIVEPRRRAGRRSLSLLLT